MAKDKHVGSAILTSIFILSMVVIPLVPIGSAAPVTLATWTTTADFDSGTKSVPFVGDGNYEVETITDNPTAAAGAIGLLNKFGDTFTQLGLAAPVSSFKWATSTANIVVNHAEIAHGVLHVSVTGTDGASTHTYRINNKATYDGTVNFNTQIKITRITHDSSLGDPTLEFCAVDVACSVIVGGAADGFTYEVHRIGADFVLEAFEWTSPFGVAQIGGNTILNTSPFYLRIERVAGNVNFYYSTNGIVWTLDETAASAGTPGSFSPEMVFYNEDNVVGPPAVMEYEFDDFSSSGTLVPNLDWKAGGDWTSAQEIIDLDIYTQLELTLTYSGASATQYIDGIEWLNSVLATVATDNTDLITGTSRVYSLPGGLPDIFYLRVIFVSDQAGTAVLESAIITGKPAGGGGGPGPGDQTENFGLDGNFEIKQDPLDCSAVTIKDIRPQSVNAILYLWDFGDGTQETTTVGTVDHHYPLGDQYTLQITVQDKSGSIQQFTGTVDTRAGICGLSGLLEALWALLIATFILGVIATVFKKPAILHKFFTGKMGKRVLYASGIIIVVVIVYRFLTGT